MLDKKFRAPPFFSFRLFVWQKLLSGITKLPMGKQSRNSNFANQVLQIGFFAHMDTHTHTRPPPPPTESCFKLGLR